ncbi:hypothetical protein [Streptosporangium sp. 'caverna']|uniref:hypothetical protein n=1 Tax=Streptosporangium sp. 'caverna' TaxID=2202249 RepID=UPI000D7DA456|nr:hypothetical protein [Streptosporangium sp. 'caverna']AWS43881.1 hypothetical protein DKM19_23535 [Streptosporangium sp. 'caverna']
MTVISDSPTDYDRVRDLVTARRTRDLADHVLGLSEDRRAEVARRLPELRRELREAADRRARQWMLDLDDEGEGEETEWDEGELESGDGIGGYGEVLRVAGAGTLSGVAAAVAWLTRREFTGPQSGTDEVLRVLSARPAAWQADAAARLAGRIRTADDRNAPLALALLRACGATPPEHDPLVGAWLRGRPSADDPLVGPLLPRIFEAEGVGRILREERLEPRPTRWLALIGRLQVAGRVSRADLLDGCLRRFLRGGDAAGLRFFVRLHRMLDPTPQEVAARTRDYLRLLPAAPGTVAELALAQLRLVGPHESADVAEAIGALTFRPEAKLALAGLRWLEEEPPPATEAAPALAAAFGHASYEVQGRAARLALRHATTLAPAGQILAEAVPLLPAALGSRVAAVFGGDVAEPEKVEVFTPPPLTPFVPEPFPEPTVRLGWSVYEWTEGERWLAAFVAQAAGDREELRRTLVAEFGGAYPDLFHYTRWLDPGKWIAGLARELIAPGSDPGLPEPEPVDPWAGTSFQVRVMAVPDTDEEAPREAEEPERPQEPGEPGQPEESAEEERAPEPAFAQLPEHVREEIFEQLLGIGVSEERVAAMRDGSPAPEPGPGETRAFRVGFTYSGPRPLFHKPEPPDPAAEFRRRNRLPHPGQVSPPHFFLLHRFSELYLALREGTLPPVLLATPTALSGHLDPDVLVDRLAACATAGVEPLPADLLQALLRLPRGAHSGAAARAAGLGSRAAATAAGWMAGDGLPDPEAGLRWAYLEGATDYFFDEREPGYRVWELRLKPVLRAAPTGHDLLDELLREPLRWSWDGHGQAMGWWPAILPSHREVVAVNYLPHLGVYAACVRGLIDADGPAGDATAIVLAHVVAARNPEAASLLVRMAARGGLPAETVGRQLALLMRRTHVEPRPVVAVLAEAARQGAYAEVWRMLTSLLPVLLPGPGQRPSVVHVEAMTLAADVAAWAGARGPIPEVTALAAGPGRSRFTRACARLRDQLNG